MKLGKTRRILLSVALLLVALAIVACTPKQAPQSSGTADGNNAEGQTAIELPAWTPQSNCETCHTTETQAAGDSAAAYSYHASQEGMQCLTCHVNDGDALAKVHEGYNMDNMPTRLKKTKVASSICLSCHNQDELKAATTEVNTLTDINDTTVNPHDMPVNEQHDAYISCASCHKMHIPNSIDKAASEVCAGCHHASVYECYTCHE